MSVEAVPRVRADGDPLSEEETKELHTTMQTLGRIALIGGLVFVALLNIWMFAGVESLGAKPKGRYLRPHLPDGARHTSRVRHRRGAVANHAGHTRSASSRTGGRRDEADRLVYTPNEPTEPNYWIFGGGRCLRRADARRRYRRHSVRQEIVFAGSMAIVTGLIYQLTRQTAGRQDAVAGRHRTYHLRVPCRAAPRRWGDMVRY